MKRLPLVAPLSLALFIGCFASPPTTELVAANDNRQSAGRLEKGVLTVALDVRNGVWHPEGERGRALNIAAFAERGKALSAPGPAIRVPVGTEVRATIRNTLDHPLTVFGFGKTRGASDSVVIAAKASREVAFSATTPGTYYYQARRGVDQFNNPPAEDMQLGGAIVVDPPNTRPDPAERIFVISWWFTIDSTSPTGLGRITMTMNGLSWPHTERLSYAQGDSVRWRVVNLTGLDHPMHLHGFYFRVNSKGDGVSDSLYDADQRRMAVTEVINPGQTMSLAWLAARPGNWIYHCHYATHISSLIALDMDKGMLDTTMTSQHTSDRPHEMFALVMGITVTPRGPQPTPSEPSRRIRLVIREKPNVYDKQPGYSFVLGGTRDEATADAMPVPGAPLVLERGQPVAITVVNASDDHAAVHWHGIELESYPDGVPGWSGSGTNVMQPIAPHDSLTVHFTPPRAGTFMYHSHFNEMAQMNGGLYGPIIVLEPGEHFDPRTDKVLFLGSAGSTRNVIFGPYEPFLMNGKTQPGPMSLSVGTRYRFRLLNLADFQPVQLSLIDGKSPVSWRAVAKDGYPLPPTQATVRPATLTFDPGETYDFEYTPRTAGELGLRFGPQLPPPGSPPPPPGFAPPPPTITVAVHVH